MKTHLNSDDVPNKIFFTLYWLTGKSSVIEGASIDEAMNNAGYGAGSLRALDFYAIGDCKKYAWDSVRRQWIQDGAA